MRFNSLHRRIFELAHQLVSSWSKLIVLTLGLSLFLTCTSCSAVSSDLLGASLSPKPLELSIRQVEPIGQPGVYAVVGNTSLPEKTKITVSAVRYLQDVDLVNAADVEPLYSILDRQYAEVSQGGWQAKLNLWQVGTDGKYQEAWQLSQKDADTLYQPSSAVTFLATLDPNNQPKNFQDQVEAQDPLIQAELARFTTDGELYLQASKALTVPLPTGSTTPPPPPRPVAPRQSDPAKAEEKPSSSSGANATTWSRTNAPLAPDELMR